MQGVDKLITTPPTQANTTPKPMEWAKVTILFGLAIYFAYIIIVGDLNNYINLRFAWLSYVAVVIFIALGGANLYGILQSRNTSDEYIRQEHTSLSWSILFVVAIPLVLGTLIPSEPLGADAVNGDISNTTVSLSRASAVTRDPLERNILEWLRVFNEGTPASFNGQQADVSGFVYREPTFGEDIFMIARFTMSCCVADASAIGFPVRFVDDGTLADGEWVRVTGTFLADNFRGELTPILEADFLEIIDQPERPYLYP